MWIQVSKPDAYAVSINRSVRFAPFAKHIEPIAENHGRRTPFPIAKVGERNPTTHGRETHQANEVIKILDCGSIKLDDDVM